MTVLIAGAAVMNVTGADAATPNGTPPSIASVPAENGYVRATGPSRQAGLEAVALCVQAAPQASPRLFLPQQPQFARLASAEQTVPAVQDRIVYEVSVADVTPVSTQPASQGGRPRRTGGEHPCAWAAAANRCAPPRAGYELVAGHRRLAPSGPCGCARLYRCDSARFSTAGEPYSGIERRDRRYRTWGAVESRAT
jgi:hypothetical protein